MQLSLPFPSPRIKQQGPVVRRCVTHHVALEEESALGKDGEEIWLWCPEGHGPEMIFEAYDVRVDTVIGVGSWEGVLFRETLHGRSLFGRRSWLGSIAGGVRL